MVSYTRCLKIVTSKYYESMIIINIFINNKHDPTINDSTFLKSIFFHEVISSDRAYKYTQSLGKEDNDGFQDRQYNIIS